jgi:nucleoside-diphosphate-sugar epimerase
MRALVTGGNGFVGRYIVEQLLARGDRVRVVGRGDYPELRALGAECVRADLAVPDSANALAEAMRGVEVVFHVAAKAGVWGSFDEYYRANVTGTQRVVRAAERAGVPKLVYTSSPSVAFGEEDVEGADEALPYPERYLSHYQHTKALAERYVLAREGLAVTAIRPPLIWGPRDPHLLPRIFARARQGRLIQVGEGRNVVDVTYVENCAEAHLLAADRLSERSPLRGRAYFIGQEHPVNMWDFIRELVTRAGYKPPSRTISPKRAVQIATLLETLYRALGVRSEPPLTRLTAVQMARSRWFDLSAARRDLGYGPRITIEEGLERTVAAL